MLFIMVIFFEGSLPVVKIFFNQQQISIKSPLTSDYSSGTSI